MTENEQKPKPKIKRAKPRQALSKSKLAIKARERKIVKALIQGKTKKQAGIEAGFSPRHPSDCVSAVLAREPKLLREIEQALLSVGIDNSYLAMEHKKLIEGKKTIVVDKETIEVVDNVAKGKGLELAYKVKGLLKDVEQEVNNSVNITINKFAIRKNPPKTIQKEGKK